MPLNRHKAIAISEVLIVFRHDALLLLGNIGPYLVAFYVPYLHASNFFGHDAFALLARKYQQLQDGRVMNFCDAFDARNAIAFEQKAKHQLGLFDGQIHTV
ncbi:MAG: hypothetical protein ACRD22_08280 [Terriglobia bacterium]